MFHPQGPTFFELAQQALSSTEHGYDLLAPKFDYTPFRTPDAVLDPVFERLAKLGPFETGLDICCGTGAGLERLAPLCRKRAVGLDLSQGMLEAARQKLGSEVELIHGDALAMPFGEEFDVVVCFGAHGHILPRDEAGFIAEVRRVLKPGGRLVFVTSYLPQRWKLRHWIARGFNAVMRVRNLLIRPAFIMYYFTFLLPRAQELLERQGFRVEIDQACFTGRLSPLKLVIATKAEVGRQKSEVDF